MRQIVIDNPVLDKTYKTRLGADYTSGTSVTVENNSSFAANDLLVFGEPSEELAEGKKLSSVSGSTTLNLASALNFAHGKGTYVYRTPWDFVYIERRVDSSSSWVEISQSGIQWDNALNQTIYYDSPANDAYGYRYRFYNSALATYSEYSPTLTGAGFSRAQVGFMIENVRAIVNDTNKKIVSDDEIIRFFNRAQDIVYTHNAKYWFLLVDAKKGGFGISATASTDIYSLATLTNFGHLSSVRYRYTSGAADELWHLMKKSSLEFDHIASNLNEATDDQAWIYKLLPADSSSDYGYIQIFPKTKTTGVGIIYPNFYEKMANLDSVDDSTQVPLPQLLEDFAISQIERIKGNESKAKLYEKNLVSEDPRATPPGLLMLDKMDQDQREVQGQPRSLWNFRGQKAMTRFFTNSRRNRDYDREFYMN